jgi:ATP-dependent Clp protease ATP-binding subunit ClpA
VFERFTERGRQVVVLAGDESRALGQPWIGTEHLLLGLIREGGEASIALEGAGLTLERARDAVTALVGAEGEPIVSGQIRFTREARRALEGSLRESVLLQAGEITPSLILLGVLTVGSGTAACVLRDCGVDVAVVVGALEMADRIDASLYRRHDDAKPEQTLAGLPVGSSGSRPEPTAESPYARFSERARQVVVLSQDEARALKHDYVGTEHILLGLLREEEGLAARVLNSLDITVKEAREQVAKIVGRGDQVASGQIPFTPMAKKVLELSLRDALSLGHNHIATEHILLSLVRANEGVAARVLLDFDADAAKIRSEVVRMLSEGQRGTSVMATRLGGQQEQISAGLRAATVGELLDSVTAAKEAALKDHDYVRAEVVRGIERQFTMIVKRVAGITGRDQSPPIDGEDEAPSA